MSSGPGAPAARRPRVSAFQTLTPHNAGFLSCASLSLTPGSWPLRRKASALHTGHTPSKSHRAGGATQSGRPLRGTGRSPKEKREERPVSPKESPHPSRPCLCAFPVLQRRDVTAWPRRTATARVCGRRCACEAWPRRSARPCCPDLRAAPRSSWGPPLAAPPQLASRERPVPGPPGGSVWSLPPRVHTALPRETDSRGPESPGPGSAPGISPSSKN